MGRLSTMKDQNNTQLVSGVTYGAAGQMLSLSGTVISETRVYNSNLQLTELTSGNTGQMGSAYHFKYNYSATQNDGRVFSITDVASGETIIYQYDTLKRLISAAGSGDPTGAWSQTFTYDGFGNLLQKLEQRAKRELQRQSIEQSADEQFRAVRFKWQSDLVYRWRHFCL